MADAAGVLFTANPVSGRHSEAMITAAWGLGEAVVGGMAVPEMLKHGYTHRAGFVAIYNLPSLAAGKHMASKVIGYAGYLDWFGRIFPSVVT